MKRLRLVSTLLLTSILMGAAPVGALAQENSAASAGPVPIQLSLMDCVQQTFKNNKQIKIESYGPQLREDDWLFQKAQFDASLTTGYQYQDASFPTGQTINFSAPPFNTGDKVIVDLHSTRTDLFATYADKLHLGGSWSATLTLERITPAAFGAGSTVFPPTFGVEYLPSIHLNFTQPLLRNFGRKVNDTSIVVASNDVEGGTLIFKNRVLDRLLEVESAYWALVFARQDLEVRNEALRLAQQLLKLNQIKVQVGTLPPIDITQAEAGVASREEAVITGEAAIRNAEDRLRYVMGMDPMSPTFKSTIIPSENMTIVEREVNLDREINAALENRTDLAAARLALKSDDALLNQRRNQLKYSLDFKGDYILNSETGNSRAFLDNGTQNPPAVEGLGDALNSVVKRDFPLYQFSLTLGIPLGNHAAEAQYSSARLGREQAQISYQNFEQAAVVLVGVAVRSVETNMKRIQAAEQNRILQEKKVEAEQKKFENGMSTSFQVLTFQNDLATARSQEIQAKTDYRISVANLDNTTGVLDKTLNVKVLEYARN